MCENFLLGKQTKWPNLKRFEEADRHVVLALLNFKKRLGFADSRIRQRTPAQMSHIQSSVPIPTSSFQLQSADTHIGQILIIEGSFLSTSLRLAFNPPDRGVFSMSINFTLQLQDSHFAIGSKRMHNFLSSKSFQYKN